MTADIKRKAEKRDCMKYGIVFATPDEGRRASENQLFADMILQAKGARQMTADQRRWIVHIVGPDDVIEQPDELTALRYANMTNVVAEQDRRENNNDPNWPYIIAIVRNLDNEKITTRQYFDSIARKGTA